ncbi:MAG: GldM family protein [Haliscomenobacter sp.]|uniref:M56 family metallopeptidase n=1 Tax=Haliscomenobacter sp. TaxID=2717303 RepID=UPI0029B532A0|nr:M56 family metallopeptidase [Haliscomenobacter sp.]MDX2067134.1 GldM family protein [Haliscomenobacter sp.]
MNDTLILSLGWTLLHSLWQIGLLGLCTLGLERLLRTYSAQLRHQVILFMLGGMVLASAFTLFLEWQYFAQVQHLAPNLTTDFNSISANPVYTHSVDSGQTPVPFLQRCKWWIESHLYWLVGIWVLGTAFFSLRFAWNYLALSVLRQKSSRVIDPQVLQLVQQVKTSLGLRQKVWFYSSSSLSSPLTFGHFSPVVILPVALLCQTPPALLEALIRHELIHIRRADFLVNLLLASLQILFFYHPLVWVLSRRIQELREEACDEAVLLSGCHKLVYAEALLHLQRLHHHQNIPLVMQAQNHASHFATRVRQILAGPSATKPQLFTQRWSSAVLLMPLLLLALGLFAPVVQAEKKTPAPKVKPTVVLPERSETAVTKTTTKPLVKDPEPISPATVEENPPPSITTATIDSLPQSSNDAVLSVAADRMNVLYMGVDNPISVAISGVPADQVKASSRDVQLIETGKGKFIAKAVRPGKATILVEAPNYRQEVEFRVKPIPDPTAVLQGSYQSNGEVSVSKIKSLKSIDLFIPVDFETGCKLLGFNLIYISKDRTKLPVQVVNPGHELVQAAQDILANAEVGDMIIFDNPRAKCPGDEASRKINSMSFKVTEGN